MTKGKGWHGESKRHSEAVKKAKSGKVEIRKEIKETEEEVYLLSMALMGTTDPRKESPDIYNKLQKARNKLKRLELELKMTPEQLKKLKVHYQMGPPVEGEKWENDITEDYPVSEHTREGGKIKVKAHTRGEKTFETFNDLIHHMKFEIAKDLKLAYGHDYRENIDFDTGEKYIEVFMDYDIEKVKKKLSNVQNLKIIQDEKSNYRIYLKNKEDYVDPKDIEKWITMRGTPVAIKKGETVKEAVDRAIEHYGSPKEAIMKKFGKQSEKIKEEVRKKEKEEKKETWKERKERLEKEGKTSIEAVFEKVGKIKKEVAEKKEKEEEKEPEKEKKSRSTISPEEKRRREIEAQARRAPKSKEKPLSEKEKKIEKLIEETGYERKKAEKIISKKEEPEADKLIMSKIREFSKSLNEIKQLKKVDEKTRARLLKRLKEIQANIEKFHGKIDYIGNITEMYKLTELRKDLTYDFIQTSEFDNISFDYTEDFSVLYGPITRAGAFEYEKNGIKVLYYKDWDNIKDVFGKMDYVPLKAQYERGSHHAKILGYATNFNPNDKTEQMFADVVLFNDIDNLTDILNPENGYAVSIGFKDNIKDNVQWIEYVDHLAMSLSNIDRDRCSTANGLSCNVSMKK